MGSIFIFQSKEKPETNLFVPDIDDLESAANALKAMLTNDEVGKHKHASCVDKFYRANPSAVIARKPEEYYNAEMSYFFHVEDTSTPEVDVYKLDWVSPQKNPNGKIEFSGLVDDFVNQYSRNYTPEKARLWLELGYAISSIATMSLDGQITEALSKMQEANKMADTLQVSKEVRQEITEMENWLRDKRLRPNVSDAGLKRTVNSLRELLNTEQVINPPIG